MTRFAGLEMGSRKDAALATKAQARRKAAGLARRGFRRGGDRGREHDGGGVVGEKGRDQHADAIGEQKEALRRAFGALPAIAATSRTILRARDFRERHHAGEEEINVVPFATPASASRGASSPSSTRASAPSTAQIASGKPKGRMITPAVASAAMLQVAPRSDARPS